MRTPEEIELDLTKILYVAAADSRRVLDKLAEDFDMSPGEDDRITPELAALYDFATATQAALLTLSAEYLDARNAERDAAAKDAEDLDDAAFMAEYL